MLCPIDFKSKCHIQLIKNEYGSIAGLTFNDVKSLHIATILFKESQANISSFESEGVHYLTAIINPENSTFRQFMQDGAKPARLQQESFFTENGFYEQTCDFWDVWEDNDIDIVHVSFKRKTQ